MNVQIEPDSKVFRCEECSFTAATGSGAAQHELTRHGGAQTCWRTTDRMAATRAAAEYAFGRDVCDPDDPGEVVQVTR